MTSQYNKTPDAPATSLRASTPSDSTTYDPPLRGLYVGVAGNRAVIGEDDTAAVTIPNALVGYHALMVKKVMSTNTTASSIVGLR